MLTLALKNLRHRKGHYAAFVLSAAFAAWLFCLTAGLRLHPSLPAAMGNITSRFFGAISLFVILFSTFFIGVSQTGFMKARLKEIGLLQLLGFGQRQLFAMLFWEHLLLGWLASLFGVLLSFLTWPLFLSGLMHFIFLEGHLAGGLPLAAVLTTFTSFSVIFAIVSLLSIWHLRRSQLAQLLVAPRQPARPPKASPLLATLALVLLGAALAIALTFEPSEVVRWFVPIMLLLLVGGYLFFTQLTVVVLRVLTRRRAFYYRNLISLSQLTFRMRANATTLFLAAVLGAGVLTGVGVTSGMWLNVEAQVRTDVPVDVQVVGSVDVEAALAADGLRVLDTVRLSTFTVPTDRWPLPVLTVEQYEQWRRTLVPTAPALSLAPGQPVFLTASSGWSEVELTEGLPLVLGERPVTVPIVQGTAFNYTFLRDFQLYEVLVMTETDAAALYASLGELTRFDLVGYRTSQPQGRLEHLAALEWGDSDSSDIRSALTQIQGAKAATALPAFVGLFVGLLFFLAAGNVLYFRVLGDLAADKATFLTLSRIGLSDGQLRRVVSVQVLVLFGLPLLAMALTAWFPVVMIERISHYKVLGGVARTFGVYMLLWLGYALVTRQVYLRQLTRGLRPQR